MPILWMCFSSHFLACIFISSTTVVTNAHQIYQSIHYEILVFCPEFAMKKYPACVAHVLNLYDLGQTLLGK